MASPLSGTAATHAACLFAAWGDEVAQRFYRQVQTNGVRIFDTEKRAAQAVAGGDLAFCLVNSDDAIDEVEKGLPLEIIYPDQEEAGAGTLFIPNTVSIIRGCPHPEAARQFVDALLTPRTETLLARGIGAQVPLNTKVKLKRYRIQPPDKVRPMMVDFPAAADKWEAVAKFLRDELSL